MIGVIDAEVRKKKKTRRRRRRRFCILIPRLIITMALLLPSVAMTCKGIRGVANASSSFFAPVFIKGVPADAKFRGRSTGVRARIVGDGDIDLYGETVADDFYSVLGLVLSPRLCCFQRFVFLFCFVAVLFVSSLLHCVSGIQTEDASTRRSLKPEHIHVADQTADIKLSGP